jgi:hypothetical protein
VLTEYHERTRVRADHLSSADVRNRTSAIIRGEQRLMLAVLDDAIVSLQKNLFATSRRGRRIRHEIESWLTSTDKHSPFAFESICDALDLDPDYVRGGVRCWRERQGALALLQASQPRRDGGRGVSLPSSRPGRSPDAGVPA